MLDKESANLKIPNMKITSLYLKFRNSIIKSEHDLETKYISIHMYNLHCRYSILNGYEASVKKVRMSEKNKVQVDGK